MGIRANTIQKQGVYIGLFEWLVWSKLQDCQVVCLMGGDLVDVTHVFGGGLALNTVNPPCHTVLVSWDHDLVDWCCEGRFNGNHYLIGMPSDASPSETLAGLPKTSARVVASTVGWGVKKTIAQGDCGIDAMSFHANRERCPAVWQDIRDNLAAVIMSVTDREDWQDAFQACQEGRDGLVVSEWLLSEPLPAAPLALVAPASAAPASAVFSAETWSVGPAGRSSSSSLHDHWVKKIQKWSSFTTGSLAPSTSPPLPAVEYANASASSLVAVGASSTSDLCSASGVGADLCSASVVGASATDANSVVVSLADGSAASVKGAVSSVVDALASALQNRSVVPRPWMSFVQHLRTMTDIDQRNLFTTDYFKYKYAEARYEVENPRPLKRKAEDPRREHRATKRRFALATGDAYKKWRESPEGKSSNAPLQDFVCVTIRDLYSAGQRTNGRATALATRDDTTVVTRSRTA